MGKVNEVAELRAIKEVGELARFTSAQFKAIMDAINGNLNFSDNLKCVILTILTPATAQLTFQVNHGLGFVPTGFMIVDRTSNMNVWRDKNSTTDKEMISLKCDLASVAATLIIF
jgi:hypothetical protein